MKVWLHIVKTLEAHGTCAMISVVKVEGSAPREAGARIVVTPLGFRGTIGGGTLEWQAIVKAQALLGKPEKALRIDGSLVWYYIYPGIGRGSVFFNGDGRVSTTQSPGLGW